MAPICLVFVQNTWKKDLCSNCFKTFDEHGQQRPNSSYLRSSIHDTDENFHDDRVETPTYRKHPITSSILNRSDSRTGERSIGDYISPSSPAGSTPLSSSTPQSRYVGVANNSRYQRNYYGGGYSPSRFLGNASEASGLKSPSLIFRSDSSVSSSGLKSPGLIKEISSSSSSSTINSVADDCCHSSTAYPLPQQNKFASALSSSTSSLASSMSNQPLQKLVQQNSQQILSPRETPQEILTALPVVNSTAAVIAAAAKASALLPSPGNERPVSTGPKSSYIFSDIGPSAVNTISNHVYKENHRNVNINNNNIDNYYQKTNMYYADDTINQRHNASGNNTNSVSEIDQSKCPKITSPESFPTARSQSADNLLEKTVTSSKGPTFVQICQQTNELDRPISVDILCSKTLNTTKIASNIYEVVQSSPQTDSNNVEQTSTATELNSSSPVFSVDSELTDEADSTDSDEHCGGFYNIEGLGGDSEDDSFPNESYTDEITAEHVPSEPDSHVTNEDKGDISLPFKSAMLKPKSHKKKNFSLSFNDEDVIIGYGGDVDYSDGDDFYNEDNEDDDDEEIISSFELTEREKLLKKLTLKNTDFNAENDNFDESVILTDSHYQLMKQYEHVCEDYDIYEDINATFDTCQTSTNVKNSKSLGSPTGSHEKADVKVKLKRSTPLISVKPFRNSNLLESPKVNPVLPMKNGELIRTRSDGGFNSSTIVGSVGSGREAIPLQGIKPRYVSKEEEIIEKQSDNEDFCKNKNKITSFDEPAENSTSFGMESKDKVTSFDEPIEKVTSDLVKIPKENHLRTKEKSENVKNVSTTSMDNDGTPKSIVKPIRKKKKKIPVESTPFFSVNITLEKSPLCEEQISKSVPVSSKKPFLKLDTPIHHDNIDHSTEKESTPSSCNRRSSFMASQLGITTNESEEHNVCVATPTGDHTTTENHVIVAESTIEAIHTQNSSSIPSRVNQNCVLGSLNNTSEFDTSEKRLAKSNRSTKQNNFHSQNSEKKEPWSDTASMDNDDCSKSSSSSSEVYKDAVSTSSHRSSHSSLMTTFGTTPPANPVGSLSNLNTNPTSFLHSEYARQSIQATEQIEYSAYTTSQEFLKDIKAPVSELTPTASIQKSGNYFASSCLKGLPSSSKPVISPRPPTVDKHRSSEYFSPCKSTLSSNNVARNLSSTFANMAINPTATDHKHAQEVVYDLPVTVASSNPVYQMQSLHYSSSPLVTPSTSDAVNTYETPDDVSDGYYEVNLRDEVNQNGSNSTPQLLPDVVLNQHLTIRDKSPRTNTNIITSPTNHLDVFMAQHGSQVDSISRTDIDSYSSFTDDFDEEEQPLGNVEQRHCSPSDPIPATALGLAGDASPIFNGDRSSPSGERSSSAAPVLRHSVTGPGPTNYNATGEFINYILFLLSFNSIAQFLHSFKIIYFNLKLFNVLFGVKEFGMNALIFFYHLLSSELHLKYYSCTFSLFLIFSQHIFVEFSIQYYNKINQYSR